MAAAMLVDDPNGSQEIYEGVRAAAQREETRGWNRSPRRA
jgi:hypothetical protein